MQNSQLSFFLLQKIASRARPSRSQAPVRASVREPPPPRAPPAAVDLQPKRSTKVSHDQGRKDLYVEQRILAKTDLLFSYLLVSEGTKYHGEMVWKYFAEKIKSALASQDQAQSYLQPKLMFCFIYYRVETECRLKLSKKRLRISRWPPTNGDPSPLKTTFEQ